MDIVAAEIKRQCWTRRPRQWRPMYSLYRTDSGGGLLLATLGLYCLFVESGEWYLDTVT